MPTHESLQTETPLLSGAWAVSTVSTQLAGTYLQDTQSGQQTGEGSVVAVADVAENASCDKATRPV